MEKMMLAILLLVSLVSNRLLACDCCNSSSLPQEATFSEPEVCYATTRQYSDFLNEQAAVEDPHELYDERMAGTTTTPALLIRSENAEGCYTYWVAFGQEQTPILYVSHKSLKRFCHWLNENQLLGDEESRFYRIADYGDCGCGGDWDHPSCICLMYCMCHK